MSATSDIGYTVSLKNVSLRKSDQDLLKDINLEIAPSEFVGIVGENGAGKSTLLGVIAGSILGASGDIRVCGTTIDSPIGKKLVGVGIVHQHDDNDLLHHLSIAQNIFIRELLGNSLPFGISGVTQKWRKLTRHALTEHIHGYSHDIDMFVGSLSGGERQILNLAIATHFEHIRSPCRLLLLDEHTARLDHINAKRVMDYTAKQVEKSRCTAIMVTHRYADAIDHCSRVIAMKDGVLIASFSGANLKALTVENLASIVENGT